MNFGETFRYYRKRSGYTQEEVARALMVTPQAVSKWETHAGTPDISLLIPISELFDVSVDELLGNSQKSRDDILRALHDPEGEDEESFPDKYRRYLDMLKNNPRSADVLTRLLTCTAEWLNKEGKEMEAVEKDRLVESAEDFSVRLRERSDRSDMAANAHGMLAEVYMAVGNFSKAEREISCLPYGRYTQARMRGNLARCQEDYEESRPHYQESICDFLVWLFRDMDHLATSYKVTDRRKMDEIYKMEYDMIRLLYGCRNNSPLPLQRFLGNACVRLAQRAAWDGDKQAALTYLEEFVAVIRTRRERGNATTATGCILFPEVTPPYDKGLGRRRGPKKELVLGRLSWSAFNSLREEERFIKLLREVESW